MAQQQQIHGQSNLWKSGVIFELRRANGAVQVFSLPYAPESLRVHVPQRVNRTKTFGGAFEDDYGLDNQAITITGSVGGNDSWDYLEGNQSGSSIKTDVGPVVLFGLLDKIVQYKKRVPMSDLADYSLRAYFLWPSQVGSSGAVPLAALGQNPSVLSVECSLDDFEYSQELDKPFRWQYKLDLFIYRQLGTFIPSVTVPTPVTVPSFFAQAQALYARVTAFQVAVQSFSKSIIDQVNTYAGYVQQSINLINAITNLPAFLAGQTLSVLVATAQATTSLMASTGTLATSLIQSSSAVIGEVKTLGDAIRLAFAMPSIIVTGAKQAFANLQANFESIGASYDLAHNAYDPLVSAGIQATTSIDASDESTYIGRYILGTGQSLSTQMYRNLSLGMMSDLTETHNAWVEATARLVIPPLTLSASPSANPVTVYGMEVVPIVAGDTLESVALRYLGDVDLAYLLAVLNGITSIDNLTPGSLITVPILTNIARNAANMVYGSDTLGTDLAVDPINNDFGVSSVGDLGVISGVSNLEQGINSRLNTTQGTYLRNLAYGLIVDAQVISTIMAQNIQDAVSQDPRVSSVSGVSLKGVEDALEVAMTIAYAQNQQAQIQGVING